MYFHSIIAIGFLIRFVGLTGYALMEVGYVGIFKYHLPSPAGWQVFADLVVSLMLLLTFLVPDARAKGINVWPWVIGTFFLGSISPLVYLALYGGPAKQKDED